MNRQSLLIDTDAAHCTMCGGFYNRMHYLSDSRTFVCDECYSAISGYAEAESSVVLTREMADTVCEEDEDNMYAAWYLFGKEEVVDGRSRITCDRALRWGYDGFGFPMFDSRKMAAKMASLAKDRSCYITVFSIPRLSTPLTSRNKRILKMTNTRFVAIVDRDNHSQYCCNRMNPDSEVVMVLPRW